MARTNTIKVEGVVVQALPNGTCKVKLANGHQLIAWGGKRAGLTSLAPGQKVLLEVTPFDLSHARLVALVNVNESKG